MISFWLVATAVVGLVAETPIQEALSGEEFAPKGGNFAVRFPGKPKQSTQKTKSPLGEVTVNTATYATKDGDVYMVSYSDLPSGATKAENLDTLFEGVRDGAKGKDSKIVVRVGERFEFGSDKLQGYKLELFNEKSDQYVKLRVIVRENRLFQIAVVGSKDFAQGKDAAEFLKSFDITK